MRVSCEAGDPAPDFDLPGEDGRRFKLADYRGRNLVLYFYPKDDTSGCTAEALEFSAELDRFTQAGAAVLGVSPDKPKTHARFRQKHGLRHDLASDEGKAMLGAYGVWVEKSMYGRKYMGVERSTFMIDQTGRIVHAWRKVKSSGHAEEVLQSLAGAAPQK